MGHLTEGLDSYLLLEAGDRGLGYLAWGIVPGETASISHYPSAMAHTEKTLALSSRPWRCWQGQGEGRHAPAFVHQQRPPQGFLNDIKLAGTPEHTNFQIACFTFHKQHINIHKNKSITDEAMASLSHLNPLPSSAQVVSLEVFPSSFFLVSHAWKTQSKVLMELC